MSGLIFETIELGNFKSFIGEHMFALKRKPGLYYVTGDNRVEPDLGANGAAKSTLFCDAPMWCLYGATSRSTKAASKIVPWKKVDGSTFVEITFKRNGERRTIRRSRQPNALLLDGKQVEQHEVNKAIGISVEAFRRTVIFPQFGMWFLDQPAERQSQLFTEILNLDIWRNAALRASSLLSVSEEQAGVAERWIASRQGALDEIRASLKRARTDRDRWDSVHDTIVAAAKRALDDAREAKNAVPAPGADVEERLQGKRDGARASERALDAERKKARACRDRFSDAKSALNIAEREYDQAAHVEDDYQAALKDKRCPECGQTVSAAHVKEKHKAACAATDTARKARDRKRDELNYAKDVSEAQDKRVVTTTETLNKAQRELADYELECTRAAAKFKEAERALKSAKNAYDIALKETNPHFATCRFQRNKRDEVIEEISGLERELAIINTKVGAARFWTAGFKEIRLALIDEAMAELEVTTNAHAEGLGLHGWDILFATERETRSGSVQYGMSAAILPPSEKSPVPWESYSGGEAQRWNLATALGLSDVLLGRAGLAPNIEVFDEPTQHLHSNGVSDLLSYLEERAQRTGKAIYLVEHHSFTRNFAGVFTIVKDKRGSHVQGGVD